LNGCGNKIPTCEYKKKGKAKYFDLQIRADTHGSPPSTAPAEWADAGEPDPSDTELWEALYAYAPKVIELAQGYGISILMLQPLNQFEGWAKGTRREQWSRAKAQKWLPLCAKLGVGQIQVSDIDDPRLFLPCVSADFVRLDPMTTFPPTLRILRSPRT
jgi:hypothetical protein